jgi:3-oxoadipate CoA-transferase alpha subunit
LERRVTEVRQPPLEAPTPARPIDKHVASAAEAVCDIRDGATIMIGGFGESGTPVELVEAVLQGGARDLTIVANNAGSGEEGLAALIRERRVSRIVCSYPRSRGSVWFERRYAEGEVALEVVPQGTLAERIRAGGSGIPAFYTPTGVGTELSEGKETRVFAGAEHALEFGLRADFALIRAECADRWGNLTYHAAARNYGPAMAMAGHVTIAEVRRIVDLGALDPEIIVTPAIFVQRLVVTR